MIHADILMSALAVLALAVLAASTVLDEVVLHLLELLL